MREMIRQADTFAKLPPPTDQELRVAEMLLYAARRRAPSNRSPKNTDYMILASALEALLDAHMVTAGAAKTAQVEVILRAFASVAGSILGIHLSPDSWYEMIEATVNDTWATARAQREREAQA